jgi:hypothetical protein
MTEIGNVLRREKPHIDLVVLGLSTQGLILG